jgi:CHASE2 domain-containing sensor protein/two-component sensor histidine kinase
VVLAGALSLLPLVREWQLRVGDSYFHLAPAAKSPVLVVLIDDQSLREFGRWPWSRMRLAQLTRNLADAGATVIGLDVLLSEPQSQEADRALADAFARSGRVVIVDKIGSFPDGPHWIEPLPEFTRVARVGHAQAVLDLDGRCRRFPARELTPDGSRWAFGVEVARVVAPAQTGTFLQRYGVPASDDGTSFVTAKPVLVPIPFRRGAFDSISAADVLGSRGLAAVRGRPVLIGFGPTEIGDRVSTPLSGEMPTPGVLVSAQIVDSVLGDRYLSEAPFWSALLLLLAAVAVVLVARRRRGWPASACFAFLAIAVYGVGFGALIFASRSVNAGPALLATLLGPLLVYAADWVAVEHSVTRQLVNLRGWIESVPGGDLDGRKDLFRRLDLLQRLQTELGSAFELHQTVLEATDNLVAIFDDRGQPILRNARFIALFGKQPMNLDALCAALLPKGAPAPGMTFESEVDVNGGLYALHMVPLPPTTIAPRGGSIVTLASLRARVERDRARAEALGFVTHELRTPLVAIQGFAELMMRHADSPESASAPETIYNESRRLLEMISSYLDVLRLDAGAWPLREERVEPAELARRVCEVLQPLAKAAQMRLTLTAEDAAPVTGDPALLFGAVLNLVSNALKYATPQTEVRIACVRRGDDSVITVSNRGTLPAGPSAPLFEAFQRGAGADAQAPGWGLGLAFVRRIVEKHGGEVRAGSEAGQTVFEMRLPAAATTLAAKGHA